MTEWRPSGPELGKDGPSIPSGAAPIALNRPGGRSSPAPVAPIVWNASPRIGASPGDRMEARSTHPTTNHPPIAPVQKGPASVPHSAGARSNLRSTSGSFDR